jgi:hypothetical protein
MTGGAISGNASSGIPGVDGGGTFTMTGGSVLDTSRASSIELSGSADIDLEYDGFSIQVTGALDASAAIRVHKQSSYSYTDGQVLAEGVSGHTLTPGDFAKFIMDPMDLPFHLEYDPSGYGKCVIRN